MENYIPMPFHIIHKSDKCATHFFKTTKVTSIYCRTEKEPDASHITLAQALCRLAGYLDDRRSPMAQFHRSVVKFLDKFVPLQRFVGDKL
jgi:hypothetical protein